MATIDNLSIQVTASAESAASALDRLASSAGGLRGAATRAGGGLRDLSAGAKDAGTATQEAGQQAGNAEKHTRNYGRAAQEAGNAAKRGTAGISDFWNALKRVAYYRFIRTIIKGITSAFREGITNIYKYSNAINGHFAKSLDSLATSTLYLKNSLGALAAPLIEALTPALNTVINLLVEVINFFSMFIAAISGQSSYTAAVKAATTATAEWGSSTSHSAHQAKEDVDKLKRSILGFDEINKLDKAVTGTDSGSGSGSGGGSSGPSPSAMFEERPLEGFFKDLSELTSGWPDWLKWLFGIGTVAIGAWGISQLPKLIGAIWDAIKNLFSTVIPDWFRWLFGPKGDGDVDIDIPDHIDIPDGKIKVDLEPGDWSALDELTDKTLSVSVKKTWGDSPLDELGLDDLKDENIPITVTLVKSKGWMTSGWKKYLGLTKLSTTIIVTLTKTKGWMTSGWKKYLGLTKLSTTIIATLTKTKGWMESGWKKYLGLTKLSTTIIATLTKTKGWMESGWKKYLGLKDLSVTITATLVKSTGWMSAEHGWKGYLGLYNASVTIKVDLSPTGSEAWKAFKDGWNNSKSNLTANVKVNQSGGSSGGGGSTSGGGAGRGRAFGGVFANGIWKNIPQYANGTTNAHGSMFLAGEAGPELVGHVGGRTEVLNQSQLAATMFSAVRAAMGGVKIAATMYDGGSNAEDDYEMMYRAMYDAFTDAMAPNNARDQEKMQLMREIAAKEFTTEVTANSINRAQQRMNRRAGTTIVPVTT